MRMMLEIMKGPSSYEEIHKICDTQFDTFRDVCFAMGFLEDDQEYIGAIKEEIKWGSGHFLCKLFIVMLLSDVVNRHVRVWNESWILLSDGMLHAQRELAQNMGSTHLSNFFLLYFYYFPSARRCYFHINQYGCSLSLPVLRMNKLTVSIFVINTNLFTLTIYNDKKHSSFLPLEQTL